MAINNPNSTFNPNERLIQIKSGQTSKDYLPVQWRLVWFRSEFPAGTIETEMIVLDLDRDVQAESRVWNAERRRYDNVVKQAKGFVIFRATVRDGQGGVATGTKSENAANFADFIEKAETGAIGRALAALGYGTQFTGDEWDEAHRIVDLPVEQKLDGAAEKPVAAKQADTKAEQKTTPKPEKKQDRLGAYAQTSVAKPIGTGKQPAPVKQTDNGAATTKKGEAKEKHPEKDATIIIAKSANGTSGALYSAALKAKKQLLDAGGGDDVWSAMLQDLGIAEIADGRDIARINAKVSDLLKASCKAS